MSCDFPHPLQREGTSQVERALPALQRGYVKTDEKDFADWIVFASEFAAHIKYYDLKNNVSGNWTSFFSTSVTALLASLSLENLAAYRTAVSDRFTILRTDANQGNLALLQSTLGALFSSQATLFARLDAITAALPIDPPLKTTILELIRTKFAPALVRLYAYQKAALNSAPPLITVAPIPGWVILGGPVQPFDTALGAGLSSAWYTNPTWAAFVASINADASIFGTGGTPASGIRRAANHTLFASIFDQTLAGLAKVVSGAGAGLAATLGAWRKHPPHYTLYLSFLKLLKLAQMQLNQFPKNHLDFYYQQGLQLQPSPAVPSSAHIVVELTKTATTVLLTAGTLFKAGKDASGNDLLCALDEDTVFSQAKLTDLMTVYKGAANDSIGTVSNEGRLFAAPVINSADGKGAAIKTDLKEWGPFVNRTYTDGALTSLDIPAAQIGFAISSRQLALAEGNRSVEIRLVTTGNAALRGGSLDLFVTAPKGWRKITGIATAGVLGDGVTPAVIIAFQLDPKDPAVTPFDPTVHDGQLVVGLPAARIMLQNDPAQPYLYDSIQHITVSQIEVAVNVGMAGTSYSQGGIKNLNLTNDFGPIDPTKPFLAFGPEPTAGSSLVIGSRELLTKPGATVRFNVEWKDLPDDAAAIDFNPQVWYPACALQGLQGGTWVDIDPGITLFDGVQSQVSFPAVAETVPSDCAVSYTDPYGPFTSQSSAGFLRLQMRDSFWHKQYRDALTAYLIDQAKPTPSVPPVPKPVEPYTPAIQSLFISYQASAATAFPAAADTDLSTRTIRFFHVYPFGEVELGPAKEEDAPTVRLLPQFSYSETPSGGGTPLVLDNVGEFYLGFQNLSPGGSLSILFQIVDGSADPLVAKPADHLYFSYLSENVWKAIPRSLVRDSTLQLLQPGLIQTAIPDDATTDNTLLPAGRIWLRLSVKEAPDAVCKLLNVYPGAARITLAEPPGTYVNLPANTVAKLRDPNPLVRQISQPYPSFGGRPAEAGPDYELRVSERLRHKDRAINIWDFERLVLQAFPEVHRVKCLSHTKLAPDPSDPSKLIYSEFAPGYVTVIVIPDLRNRNDANPLRPYASTDLLTRVEQYLSQRGSCHAHIGAANPLFEEVRMEFEVTLLKGYDDAAFYMKLLQQQITQRLAPWAYDASNDLSFGGVIYKSALIDFIEHRPYVDFLTNVKLYHKAGDNAVESGDLEEVHTSTARSVLVPAAADKHVITVHLHTDVPGLTEICQHNG